jgi:hypothetical protein
MAFNVVYQYTPAAGGYEGIRTSRQFPSEEDFAQAEQSTLETVIASGISEEEVDELVAKTPLKSYIGAALVESKGEDGKPDPFLLEMELGTKFYAAFGGDVPENLIDSFVQYVKRMREPERLYKDSDLMESERAFLADVAQQRVRLAKLARSVFR